MLMLPRLCLMASISKKHSTLVHPCRCARTLRTIKVYGKCLTAFLGGQRGRKYIKKKRKGKSEKGDEIGMIS